MQPSEKVFTIDLSSSALSRSFLNIKCKASNGFSLAGFCPLSCLSYIDNSTGEEIPLYNSNIPTHRGYYDDKKRFKKILKLLKNNSIDESYALFVEWTEKNDKIINVFSPTNDKKSKTCISVINRFYENKNYIKVYKYMTKLKEHIYDREKSLIYTYRMNNPLNIKNFYHIFQLLRKTRQYFNNNLMVGFYSCICKIHENHLNEFKNSHKISQIKTNLENAKYDVKRLSKIFPYIDPIVEYFDDKLMYKSNVKIFDLQVY